MAPLDQTRPAARALGHGVRAPGDSRHGAPYRPRLPEGHAGPYYWYLLLSVGGTLIFCRNRGLAWALAAALAAAWFVLSWDYVGLVHTDHYIGNPGAVYGSRLHERPSRDGFLGRITSRARQGDEEAAPGELHAAPAAAGDTVAASHDPDAGPAEEIPPGLMRERPDRMFRAVWCWYTPITHLWRLKAIYFTTESAGGQLSDAADKIRIRESVESVNREHP